MFNKYLCTYSYVHVGLHTSTYSTRIPTFNTKLKNTMLANKICFIDKYNFGNSSPSPNSISTFRAK